MPRPSDKDKKGVDGLSEPKIEDIEERARLRATIIYRIVRHEGRTDMARPVVSLFWSGLAAGLSLSFSLLAQAILYRELPDAPWRPLVSDFGYSVGFLMVVLSRQQLFTESTISAVLPLLAHFTRHNLFSTARLWAVVFAANIIGTFFAAAFCSFSPALSADIRHAMVALSQQSLGFAWWEMLFRGVSAGFLIAAMVWLIPSARGAEFHVIVVVTYLIAIGGFVHIVAGSVEGFMLVLAGVWSPAQLFGGFMAPTLIGNIIGGTALFALISYAQVMEEM